LMTKQSAFDAHDWESQLTTCSQFAPVVLAVQSHLKLITSSVDTVASEMVGGIKIGCSWKVD
jgi:hypothetical protein